MYLTNYVEKDLKQQRLHFPTKTRFRPNERIVDYCDFNQAHKSSYC